MQFHDKTVVLTKLQRVKSKIPCNRNVALMPSTAIATNEFCNKRIEVASNRVLQSILIRLFFAMDRQENTAITIR